MIQDFEADQQRTQLMTGKMAELMADEGELKYETKSDSSGDSSSGDESSVKTDW